MNTWEPTDNKILGRMCLIATYSKGTADRDLILVGRHGFIYPYSDSNYMVVITSPTVGNKYLQLEEKMKKGEEVGVIVSADEGKQWLKRLKVPNSRPSQLKLMEEKSK